MRPTANPHLLHPGYVRRSPNSNHAAKFYQPLLFLTSTEALKCRRVFRTATGALGYARRVQARWSRLYRAVVVLDAEVRELQESGLLDELFLPEEQA